MSITEIKEEMTVNANVMHVIKKEKDERDSIRDGMRDRGPIMPAMKKKHKSRKGDRVLFFIFVA